MDQGAMKPAAIALAMLLAGCGGGATQGQVQRPVAPGTTQPPVYQPRPVTDQCGAETLQALVGQPRTSIPVPVDVSNRRVACTSCPITEDFRADRLTILFNRDTGLVERVYCG